MASNKHSQKKRTGMTRKLEVSCSKDPVNGKTPLCVGKGPVSCARKTTDITVAFWRHWRLKTSLNWDTGGRGLPATSSCNKPLAGGSDTASGDNSMTQHVPLSDTSNEYTSVCLIK